MNKHNRFKIVLGVLIANGIRLLKIIPNNDPIMSMALPFSRRSSALTSFAFPFITMASFDVVTGYVGLWTLVTSITYGLLGLFFHRFLKEKDKVGLKTYLGCGALGVLAFDIVTGVLATPLLFGMTFEQALIGQIPFTALHLITTTAFIIVITPLLDKQVLLNKKLDDSNVRMFVSKLISRVNLT
ncbi:MAG: hypothetical protein ABSD68_01205 [Candidatus Micrarchaeales archaeon]|jgi:uncharacterized membrane protein